MNRSMTFVEQGSVRFERFNLGGKAVLWVIRPGESSADQDWDARQHIIASSNETRRMLSLARSSSKLIVGASSSGAAFAVARITKPPA